MRLTVCLFITILCIVIEMFAIITNILPNTNKPVIDQPPVENSVLLFDIDTTFKLPIQYLERTNCLS